MVVAIGLRFFVFKLLLGVSACLFERVCLTCVCLCSCVCDCVFVTVCVFVSCVVAFCSCVCVVCL